MYNSEFSRKHHSVYELNRISDFQYHGKAKKTDHPLKGGVYDYFGFETNELVIAEVHNEGNLSFLYDNKLVNFGREVYSWDAEKLNELFSQITNNQLQIGNLPLDAEANISGQIID